MLRRPLLWATAADRSGLTLQLHTALLQTGHTAAGLRSSTTDSAVRAAATATSPMEASSAAAGGATGGGHQDSVEVFGRRWDVLPRMVVFDVDYTLWPYWVDTHTRAPYMKATDGSGKIWDASRTEIVLFPETAKVLTALRAVPGLQLAYASRTGQPRWLEQLAKLLPITSETSMWDLPDYREIYPGSKLKHFERLSTKSSIPCSEMLFFDDEPYSNMEVTQLGVTFIDAEGGITEEMVVAGLEEFASKSKASPHAQPR